MGWQGNLRAFMETNLIQCRELFGPQDRQDELKEVWRRNEGLFDHYTHPEGRPTFSELFALCRPGMVNVIANSDIYFERLAHFPKPGEVWALSRYDVDPTGAEVLWDYADSQDSYIVFGGPYEIDASTVEVRTDGEHEIKRRPFVQGMAGCDNRLIHVLRMAGFNVSNPAKTIRSYHLHLSKYRSYVDGAQGDGRGGKKLDRIQPPYQFAKPTAL